MAAVRLRRSSNAADLACLTSIEATILEIRGQRVILDVDLALLFGVLTKRLNEQVKRNHRRFPPDFAFQLEAAEKAWVVANCDRLRRLRFSHVAPRAFTEHGAIMAANVLNSPRAIEASVLVVRAFVRLRRSAGFAADPWRHLSELDRKYEARFKEVFEALQTLMEPPPLAPARRIGFKAT